MSYHFPSVFEARDEYLRGILFRMTPDYCRVCYHCSHGRKALKPFILHNQLVDFGRLALKSSKMGRIVQITFNSVGLVLFTHVGSQSHPRPTFWGTFHGTVLRLHSIVRFRDTILPRQTTLGIKVHKDGGAHCSLFNISERWSGHS